MDLQALRFQHGAREGADRAFAVGAGDMDDGRDFAFGMAELGEETLDAAKPHLDAARVQRGETQENRIATDSDVAQMPCPLPP